MPRKYLTHIFFTLLLLSLAYSQSNICYSNCKEGYCSDTSPRQCTACERGQVNINGRCISGSAQPYPLTYLTVSDKNQLTDGTATSTYFNCTVSSTSFFNPRAAGVLLYETVPGTTFTMQITIPEKHEYVQFKFNAAVVQSTTAILEYELQDEKGVALLSTRQPNARPNDTTLQIQCREDTNVQNVFFIKNAISTTASKLTLQVRSLDANSVFGVSNFEIYYGSCHRRCKTCSGPTDSQCLTCQGLYMRNVNGTCQTCPLGFYDGGNECRSCPANCESCQFNNITQAVFCNSCLSYAEFFAGSCITKYEYFALPSDLVYKSAFGWKSSELSSQPITLCGRYSLIGGVSIGRQSSTLFKTFTNLEVHNLVDIYLTFWLIDQQPDDTGEYMIYVDGVLVKDEIVNIAPAQNDWILSNECGNSNPELSFLVKLSKIPHSGRNLTVSVSSSKNFFGFRDFNLIVNNKTGVIDCYEEQNGQCLSCLNGFRYDPVKNVCNSCSEGYYLIKGKSQCEVCPVECKSCEYDLGNSQVRCLTCYSPLEMVSGECKDTTAAIYSREIIPSTLMPQTNNWVLYPKLPQKGITTCRGETIIGAEQIKYKFLKMQRQFTNLPPHRGVKIYLHFYQIDLYNNNSVEFVLNGRKYPYTPSIQRKEICGDPLSLDSIVKVDLQDNNHVQSSLMFEVIVNGKIKLGINNVILFLLNCDGCNNQVGFRLQSIPVYSLSTPPVKGLEVKVIFDQQIYNRTLFSQAIWFSIKDSNNAQQNNNNNTTASNTSAIQPPRLLQGLINYNSQLPFAWQEIVANIEYRSFLELDQDYTKNQLTANPVGFWQLAGQSQDRTKLLNSLPLTSQLPRYIDIDQNNIQNRKNMRNLRNLLQGCAIFGLWIGLLSFVFGFSSAFDDFFILLQVVFVHVFIQLAYSPPSFRVPLEGMQVVQFMAWLPWEARTGIQKGIIATDLYQHSPIQYEQYYKDIVFARTIYHTILFLIFMVVLFLLLKIFSHIVSSTPQSKQKYADSYTVKYINDYQHYRFSYLDKFMRFAYFTVVWACTLQFVEFENSPKPFHIWNSIVCIVMFVVFALYPIGGFLYLWKKSGAMSDGTFRKNYQELRVRPGVLFHFVWRYYRLLLIALLIGLVYKGNPLAILIPLIVVHIVDGVMIIVLKPFGMEQEQQLNVCFYNYYPKAYLITSAVQSFLFALLELFILITYAVRQTASNYSYLGLGYFCCAIVIALLVNGLVRLVWGFVKIVEGCFSKSKEMKLQVENKAVKEKENNEEMVPIKSIKELNSNINTLQTRSRLNTLRKQSYVSKIS